MIMCAGSVEAARLPDRAEGGGSSPTPALFRKQDYEVQPCWLETAQRLTKLHHYAGGGSNTAVLTAGLFLRGTFMEADCLGITWWIPPTKSAALATFPEDWNGVLCLSRLVCVPGLLINACSFLLRHSMRFLDRGRWPCLVTYADEWRGHAGTIYKASGWTETGWTKPERRYVKNGRLVSRKAGPHTRTHAEMLALGCVCMGSFRARRFIHVEKGSCGQA